MKAIFLLTCLISSYYLTAQSNELRIFHENVPGGVDLFAVNDAYCPMSMEIELKMENLEVVGGKKEVYVVPARTSKFKLLELRLKNPKKGSNYSSRHAFTFGDALKTEYNKEHVYYLPFRKGQKFLMFQGYNGKESHHNMMALDFELPEGTAVTAARAGVVIDVEESHTESCPQEDCGKYNNFVLVYHEDGTLAEYTHLQQNGAKVEVGQKLKAGDLIGSSGKVGRATGPHLHFICFLPKIDKRISVPTLFKVDDGKKVTQLQEGETYSRNY